MPAATRSVEGTCACAADRVVAGGWLAATGWRAGGLLLVALLVALLAAAGFGDGRAAFADAALPDRAADLAAGRLVMGFAPFTLGAGHASSLEGR